ncbi:MAG: ACP S-malonyltransferase [Candidatus Magnetomorum sp.]|nr:ACP S-malonyltransferase [Candidatus Magnetomorum sp.]
MKAFIFPGQGSQKKRMGKKLFEKYNELTSIANEILGYSIQTLCLEDPDDNLGQTQYTQPALFVVNALTWLDTIENIEQMPDYLAGHSLGEYNALFAAKAFEFEVGLKLVKKRGELMALSEGGGMAAIIGIEADKIKTIIEENQLTNVFIANYNSPSQIVISGQNSEIVKAEPIFKSSGAKMYIKLNVSGAFHTHFMNVASEEFSRMLNDVQYNDINIPVISNVTARPYTGNQIAALLCQQLTSPVQWTDSIRYLMGKGVDDFQEIGPGNVLKGLVLRISKEATPLVIDTAGEKTNDEDIKKKSKMSVLKITADTLGSSAFKKVFHLKYAYISGAMFRGISSKEMVIAMGKAGMMGFLGTGGMDLSVIEDTIKIIQKELGSKSYGMNLLHSPFNLAAEEKCVDLYLKYNVPMIEASAFIRMTPALIKYRLSGLHLENGSIVAKHKIIGKISRPEVAEAFLSPAPEKIVKKLIAENKITSEQAELSTKIPVADALCVEADSGGHTDAGIAYTLMPSITKLRDEMVAKYGYPQKIFIGAAGGIGTPAAAAAAFILGADFILTGSINQCTVEADTSDMVKDMLQNMNVQDTEYAPAGDMFELGAKVQVLRKGVFFPARANKLYELYRQNNSLDEIDQKTQHQLQDKFFKKSFDDIYEQTRQYFLKNDPDEIQKAENNPKHKMALVFRWYFWHSTNMALKGVASEKVNFQIHTGPALGAFNQWVKRTDLENWTSRHVDKLAIKMMTDTAHFLNQRFESLVQE